MRNPKIRKTRKFLHGFAVIFTLQFAVWANANSALPMFSGVFDHWVCDHLRHSSCEFDLGAEIRVMINHFRSLNAVIVVRTVTTIGDADVLCIAFLQFLKCGAQKR